jgi:hypothetical protein
MRFVGVRSQEHQAALMRHKTREGIITFAQYRDVFGQFQFDRLTRRLLILLI